MLASPALRRLPFLIFLTACLAAAALFPSRAHSHAEEKKVLILNSYHRGYKGSDNLVDSFMETVLKRYPEANIQIEYLDSLHYGGPEFDAKVLDLLRFKYRDKHFDLIYSTDDYAFNVLDKNRDAIFGSTPVVFCGTNSFDNSRLAGKTGFSGIDERPSFHDTLDLMLRLHPDTNEIVVIHDTSVTGQRNSAEFRSQSAAYRGRVAFRYLAGRSMDELEERVKELEPGTLVMYFAAFVDARDGHRIPAAEAQQRLASLSQVPFYGGWEFLLGKGIVGGRLLDLKQHGVAAADMALRILDSGARIAPVVYPSPNRFMFDYKRMRRFGIDEASLPPGSVIVNRPPDFVETYGVALLSAICAALFLALIGIMIKLMKSRRELAVSLAELKEAQSELVETARKAGMAEVAINMLHNVGNVLNSVNVSAGVITGMVRQSRAKGLGLTVELLKEHAGRLDTFLTLDERGRLLPGYLEKLSHALAEEHRSMLDELGQLTKSVDHIKDIVAMQRSYAGRTSVMEPVQVTELVRDALAINEQILIRFEVRVIEQYAELPVVPLDKTRVLQILVNLVSNAAHAMCQTVQAMRTLTVTTELTPENRLRITVADRGQGIAPENLSRIFSHGFTTRRSGHGFGLHSCALAAHEMDGTLTAASAGPDQGATFALELPWPQEATFS